VIARIQTHNVLNGLVFSVAEFAVTILILAPFAAYYVRHAQVLYALGALGIILNCSMFVVCGVRQYVDKVPDLGLRRMLDARVRGEVHRANPHLGADTAWLVVTSIVPFAMFAWVMHDWLTGQSTDEGRMPVAGTSKERDE
jgi:hypothetical protein